MCLHLPSAIHTESGLGVGDDPGAGGFRPNIGSRLHVREVFHTLPPYLTHQEEKRPHACFHHHDLTGLFSTLRTGSSRGFCKNGRKRAVHVFPSKLHRGHHSTRPQQHPPRIEDTIGTVSTLLWTALLKCTAQYSRSRQHKEWRWQLVFSRLDAVSYGVHGGPVVPARFDVKAYLGATH